MREGVLLEEVREELEDVERGLAECGGSEPALLVEAVEAENMCLSAAGGGGERAHADGEPRRALPHGLSRIGRCALAGEHFREKR